MDSLWQQLSLQVAQKIEEYLSVRFERLFLKLLKREINVVFSEREAAEFLKVSLSTLQNYRKQGLIEFCEYPSARGTIEAEKRNAIYSYDYADLMNFRARFHRRTIHAAKFKVAETINFFGPEIEERRVA